MFYFLFSTAKVRLFLVLSLFLALFLTVSLGATKSVNRANKDDDSSYLLREGTRLEDTAGFFQAAGERTIFFMPEERRRLICLENLALQRVKTQPANSQWRVRGAVTEYNGENYFLIEMAVMTSVK